MKLPLEQQVTSLELSKKLKELGVKQESCFIWAHYLAHPRVMTQIDAYKLQAFEECSAFTVAELGEMLPQCSMFGTRTEYWFNIARMSHGWEVGYVSKRRGVRDGFQVAPSESDARAKLLIHLIEQKIIDPAKL